MCGPKGYGFSAVLVLNRVWFLYSSLDLGKFLRRSYFFIIIDNTINNSPSYYIMFRATLSDTTVLVKVSNFSSGQGSKNCRRRVEWGKGGGPHTPTRLFWGYFNAPSPLGDKPWLLPQSCFGCFCYIITMNTLYT